MKHMAFTGKHMAAIFECRCKIMILKGLAISLFFAERVYGNGFMVLMVMVENHMDVYRGKMNLLMCLPIKIRPNPCV